MSTAKHIRTPRSLTLAFGAQSQQAAEGLFKPTEFSHPIIQNIRTPRNDNSKLNTTTKAQSPHNKQLDLVVKLPNMNPYPENDNDEDYQIRNPTKAKPQKVVGVDTSKYVDDPVTRFRKWMAKKAANSKEKEVKPISTCGVFNISNQELNFAEPENSTRNDELTMKENMETEGENLPMINSETIASPELNVLPDIHLQKHQTEEVTKDKHSVHLPVLPLIHESHNAPSLKSSKNRGLGDLRPQPLVSSTNDCKTQQKSYNKLEHTRLGPLHQYLDNKFEETMKIYQRTKDKIHSLNIENMSSRSPPLQKHKPPRRIQKTFQLAESVAVPLEAPNYELVVTPITSKSDSQNFLKHKIPDLSMQYKAAEPKRSRTKLKLHPVRKVANIEKSEINYYNSVPSSRTMFTNADYEEFKHKKLRKADSPKRLPGKLIQQYNRSEAAEFLNVKIGPFTQPHHNI